MNVCVLEREMYSEAEAARLLQVAQNTLHYWLEGGEQRGKTYKPIIRAEPLVSRAPVSWAEFIEAGLLREYRQRQVPMAELRAFIDGLRERSGVPYPLAPTSWASPRRSSRSGPTSPTPATPAASCTSVSARPAPSRAPRRSILNGSPRRQGWLIITRDSQIQDRRAEITAVRDHGARMVALAGKDATSTWTQLEVLMCQWRAIESHVGTPGPFIFTATRTSLKAVALT